MIKITVVTVCLNVEKTIEKTILSILNQKYKDFEYMIIDGKSTDNTLDIINKYVPLFEEKSLICRCISEKDDGIFDAMNKAVDLAEGEWVIFINAGDTLFDVDVLQNISEYFEESVDFIYGDIVIEQDGWFKRVCSKDLDENFDPDSVPHQGSIVRTSLINDYKFDTNYKTCADYDFFLRLYKDGKTFKRINLIFATFLMGGVSTTSISRKNKEINLSRRKNNYKTSKLSHAINLLYYRVRNILIKIFPFLFFSEIRGWIKDKNNIR